MQFIKRLLSSAFEMVDLGEIHSCLGIQVQCHHEKGLLFLRQTQFIEDIIEKFGLGKAHSANTPCFVSSTKYGATAHDDEALPMSQPYVNLIGCLQFIGLNTRHYL